MILNFCAVCGSTDDIKQHHFTPRSHGGSDDETNLLTLCQKHHCEIHGMSYRDKVNHRKLTMEGLQKARERGVKLGNPNLVEYNKNRKRTAKILHYRYEDEVLDLKSKGFTHREICQEFEIREYKTNNGSEKWHPAQISRILSRIKTE